MKSKASNTIQMIDQNRVLYALIKGYQFQTIYLMLKNLPQEGLLGHLEGYPTQQASLDDLKMTVKYGANVDMLWEYDFSLLMIAIFHGNYQAVNFLLESGCDKEHVNAYGQTAVSLAYQMGDTKSLMSLIRHGAEYRYLVGERNPIELILLLAEKGLYDLELAELLIDRYAGKEGDGVGLEHVRGKFIEIAGQSEIPLSQTDFYKIMTSIRKNKQLTHSNNEPGPWVMLCRYSERFYDQVFADNTPIVSERNLIELEKKFISNPVEAERVFDLTKKGANNDFIDAITKRHLTNVVSNDEALPVEMNAALLGDDHQGIIKRIFESISKSEKPLDDIIDDIEHLLDLNGQSEQEVEKKDESTCQVVDIEMIKKIKEGIAACRVKSAYEKLIAHLEQEGSERLLMRAPEGYSEKMEELRRDYPNMSPFLDFVDTFVAYSQMTQGKHMQMPPVLLVSKPGLGKTACVAQVAKLFEIPFKVSDFSISSANFNIVGSSSHWSDAKSGLIFDMIVREKVANGILLCDEIDKCGGDQRYPVINVFYTLLEKNAAKEYRDEFFQEFTIDASNLIYVATANSALAIPEPILSRFRVIEIPEPTAEQMVFITKSIYRSIIKDEELIGFPDEIDEELIGCLAKRSPRDVKIILKSAFANASKRYIKNNISDVRLIDDDLDILLFERKRAIGFVH